MEPYGALHAPPTSSTPPAKRQRFLAAPPAADSDTEMLDAPAKSVMTLASLPLEALKHIFRHLHECPSLPVPTASWLCAHVPLRTVCRAFRDAFDAHVTQVDLANTPPNRLEKLIAGYLPWLPALSVLRVQGAAAVPGLAGAWETYFSRATGRVVELTFAPERQSEGTQQLAEVLASGCGSGLETVFTTSGALVRALVDKCRNVQAMHLLMDDGVDAGLLPGFAGLRTVKLLYRQTMQQGVGWRLAECLKRCAASLSSVELRLNGVEVGALEFLTAVPRLRKVSVFDGSVASGAGGRGMGVFARCPFLEEVQLEWVCGLRGEDVAEVARGMGARLRQLRIWNCEEVGDEGLEAVARWCPLAEVELRFVREQFRPETLALFGERVSWGSYDLYV